MWRNAQLHLAGFLAALFVFAVLHPVLPGVGHVHLGPDTDHACTAASSCAPAPAEAPQAPEAPDEHDACGFCELLRTPAVLLAGAVPAKPEGVHAASMTPPGLPCVSPDRNPHPLRGPPSELAG